MRIASIHVHPIKSCRGVDVAEARIDARGLVHDRRYMIVDEDGRFVSLRTDPTLTLVTLAIEPNDFVLRAPGEPELRVPHALAVGPRVRATVWSDTVDALEHPGGSALFSRVLGRAVRLVHMPESSERAVNPARAKPTDRVGFADAYPVLLLGRASVDDLSAHVGRPMEMTRFRPNLVLEGAEPYAEDRFAELRIGHVTFRGPKACDRCVATTVDPSTAQSDVEPLRTLARIRRANGKVWLGMNLIHDGPGVVHVGDAVTIIRMHESPAFG